MNKFIKQAKLPRKAYDQELSLEKSVGYFAIKEKRKRWCRRHPTGLWLEGYNQCVRGFKLNEDCEKGEKT